MHPGKYEDCTGYPEKYEYIYILARMTSVVQDILAAHFL